MTIDKITVSTASFFVNQGYTYNQIMSLLERLYPKLAELEIMAIIKRAQDEQKRYRSGQQYQKFNND